MSTPVLCVSGAGLPAWIWDDVRERLDRPTRVVPPARPGAALSDHVDTALAAASDWGRFTVVAHSIGGVVASQLVARAPARISGLVAVAACIPAPGQSFLQSLPFPQRHVLSLVMRVAGTRPPAKEIREGLCRGVDPATADRIVDEFRPESPRLYRDRVSDRRMPPDRLSVRTTQDTQLSPAQQDRYAAVLGGARASLRTGHLPMLQNPDGLARLIATVP
jgi:pimeloyl-ACP methyl ester carboxylesterase